MLDKQNTYCATAVIPMLVLLAFLPSSAAQGADANGGPAAGRWWSKCTVIADDAKRLACFDAFVPTEDSTPNASAKFLSDANDRKEPVAAAADQQGTLPTTRTERFQLSFGYGMGIAGHHGSFKVQHGRMDLRSGLGNSGDAYFIQGWMMRWPARDLKVGLEYVHFQNESDIIFNLPHGFSVLTDPVTAIVHAQVNADLGIANIAYEPALDFPIKPYIGAGLGIGMGSGSFSLTGNNAFIGPVSTVSDGSSPIAMTQGFMGVDIPVYQSYSIGLQGKVIWLNGHIIGVDQRYLNFIFGASVGKKF